LCWLSIAVCATCWFWGKSEWVLEVYWAVARVGVEIVSAVEAQRIFAKEAPSGWIDVARSEVVEIRFAIELAGRETERVRQGTAGRSLVSEGIERIGLR
jgi:hypothetical protein